MALNMSTDEDTIKKCMIEYKAINVTYNMDSHTGKVTYVALNYLNPWIRPVYSINNSTLVASVKIRINDC